MSIKYDLGKLEDAVYDFNRATGVSISIYDANGRGITTRGAASAEYCQLVVASQKEPNCCSRSNRALIEECRRTKRMAQRICDAGLLDITIPLLHRDEIVGFLMVGQIKRESELPPSALEIPAPPELLAEKYSKIPLTDGNKTDSIINIATMLTKYIMLENMVISQQRESASVIASYVEEHLGERLTVSSVASGVHLSPSGIYKCMHQSYGCTLGEYVRDKRIQRACRLLEETDRSVESVSEAVGFTDSAYFSRCFKRARGVSPREYRRLSSPS